MKALILAGDAAHPAAEIADVPPPAAAADEVIVAVDAVGLSRMEPHWLPQWQMPDGQPRHGPVVLGREFSGTVAAVGGAVRRWREGDKVIGMTGDWAPGAAAERVAVAGGSLLPLPAKLDPVLAAAIPLSGLTAWQGLLDHGRLQRGETVLVHGGAGAVGAFAIQIARRVGARVVATAGEADLSLCRSLGADVAIDYRNDRFEEQVRDVDLVFDPIGGEVQERSWGVLRRGGRLITIAGEAEDAPDPARAEAMDVDARFFIFAYDPATLGELARLAVGGDVVPIIGLRLALADSPVVFDPRCRPRGKPVALVGALGSGGSDDAGR